MDAEFLKRGEMSIISGCFLFSGIDKKIVLKAVCDGRCRLAALEKGRALSAEVDYRNCLCLILSGAIRVSKETNSRFVMNVLRRGDLFGAADLYDEGDELVTVLTAISECRIIIMTRPLIESLMREEFAVSENYIRFLTGRVKFLNDKIQALAAAGAETALASYLDANAAENGGRTTVKLAGSISALAEQLNIGRASLYRSFEKLEKAGIIEKSGREIVITDFEKLIKVKMEAKT